MSAAFNSMRRATRVQQESRKIQSLARRCAAAQRVEERKAHMLRAEAERGRLENVYIGTSKASDAELERLRKHLHRNRRARARGAAVLRNDCLARAAVERSGERQLTPRSRLLAPVLRKYSSPVLGGGKRGEDHRALQRLEHIASDLGLDSQGRGRLLGAARGGNRETSEDHKVSADGTQMGRLARAETVEDMKRLLSNSGVRPWRGLPAAMRRAWRRWRRTGQKWAVEELLFATNALRIRDRAVAEFRQERGPPPLACRGCGRGFVLWRKLQSHETACQSVKHKDSPLYEELRGIDVGW